MLGAGRRSAAFGLLAAAFLVAPASAARNAAPADSTPITISYEGSFDLSNTMVPNGVQHSFVYHVQWVYRWSGTWGELFDGSTFSNETSFRTFGISGRLHATWRDSPGSPELMCTLRILPVTDDFPDFLASYDPTKGSLKISGLASGAVRFGRYVGSNDPMCGGGPDIDIFGAPASWNPAGAAATTLSLATGGVHRYDRTWRWTYRFDSRQRRDYVSSMHTAVQVGFSPAA